MKHRFYTEGQVQKELTLEEFEELYEGYITSPTYKDSTLIEEYNKGFFSHLIKICKEKNIETKITLFTSNFSGHSTYLTFYSDFIDVTWALHDLSKFTKEPIAYNEDIHLIFNMSKIEDYFLPLLNYFTSLSSYKIKMNFDYYKNISLNAFKNYRHKKYLRDVMSEINSFLDDKMTMEVEYD